MHLQFWITLIRFLTGRCVNDFYHLSTNLNIDTRAFLSVVARIFICRTLSVRKNQKRVYKWLKKDRRSLVLGAGNYKI